MAGINEKERQDKAIAESLRSEREADRVRAAERVKPLTEAISGIGTSPVWQDVKGATKKAKTALGVGGAGIWDTAADVVEYLTGMKGRRLMPEAGPEFEQAWGIKEPTAKPAVATAPTIAAAQPVPAGIAPQFVTDKTAPPVAKKEAAHPLAKYTNIYEALRDMKDYQFKRFVDEHDGITGTLVPGIGYVTTKDKEGHEKIVRVIQNPAEKPEEPMTIPQAEVASRMMAGIGAREDRRLAREEASEARTERNVLLREGIEARKEGTAETTALRRDQGIERTIAAVGTVADPDTGEKVVNPGLAIHRLNLTGFKKEDLPKHYQPIWDKVTTAFDKFMTDWETKINKGKKATEEQRKAGAKAFEKYLR